MGDFNNSLNTSVTVADGNIIVSFTNDITDDEVENCTQLVLMRVNRSSIKGAILDFSMVHVLDAYTFEALDKLARSVSLMGVMVVWSGLSPGVVSALLDLNVDASRIKAAVDLDQGIKMISDTRPDN